MEKDQALSQVATLIAEARKDRFPSRRQFALATGLDIKTVMSVEKGEREIHPKTQRRMEQALGWRFGVIEEIITGQMEGALMNLTVADLASGSNLEDPRTGTDGSTVTPASMLSDEELLAELAYRFRTYKIQSH